MSSCLYVSLVMLRNVSYLQRAHLGACRASSREQGLAWLDRSPTVSKGNPKRLDTHFQQKRPRTSHSVLCGVEMTATGDVEEQIGAL